MRSAAYVGLSTVAQVTDSVCSPNSLLVKRAPPRSLAVRALPAHRLPPNRPALDGRDRVPPRGRIGQSLLRAKPSKGGDAESRGYRGSHPPLLAGPPAKHRRRPFRFSGTAGDTAATPLLQEGGFMRTTFSLAAALIAATCTTVAALAQTGNGAPSGSHYNLNIIGVSHDKSANMNQGSGNVIFVDLGSKDVSVTSKILLSQAATGVFGVIDKNGTDGEASFELPAPGSYTIWARELGKPGGGATMTTCATDITVTGPEAGDICSILHE